MSFLGGPPTQAKKPLAEVLPDGRKRLTRYFRVNSTGVVPPELNQAPGTPDIWTTEVPSEVPSGWTGLLRTYMKMKDSERGFPQGAEDDKPILELIFEQISATTETQTGGDPRIQPTNGLQRVEFTYVMFSSNAYSPQTPGVSTGPSPFSSLYLWEEKCEDDGTLRNITRTYQLPGTVETSDESLQEGALLLKKIVSFKTVPSTPSGYTPVGTPVQNPNGYPIYTYTFAKGTGLAAQYLYTRKDGLLEVTNISLGTRVAPSGVIIKDDYKNADGYIIYTVASIQTAAGGTDPTTETFSFERYHPFTYPGRVKPYSEVLGPVTSLNTFVAPPVETIVKATVTISYQTSNALGTVSPTIWAPNEWATERATWVGPYGFAASRVRYHNGCRATTTTPLTITGSGFNAAIYGYNVYASTTATIVITGGPSAPDGSNLSLSAELEPAFFSTTGVPYYRKTIISATIPAQPSLPV